MVRKHKVKKSSADLKIEKQVRDPPNSVSSKSSTITAPPSLCHGSESCGCFCHYAQDDPPPCYNCCQEQADDYSLAQKVLLGKKDSLSRGKSYHVRDYVLRDEFGVEIKHYKKKKNKKALKASKVLHDESSSSSAFGAKDSLRLNREFSLNQVEDLDIENLLIAANKYKFGNHRINVNNIFDEANKYKFANHRVNVNNIVDRDSHLNRHPQQHKRHYVQRDQFGLDIHRRNNSEVKNHAGCTIS